MEFKSNMKCRNLINMSSWQNGMFLNIHILYMLSFRLFYHVLSFSLELWFPGVTCRLSFFCMPFEREAFISFSGRGNEGADIPISSYTTVFVLLPSLKIRVRT